MKIINWIKNIFKKKEFDIEKDVDKFIKESNEELENKLKIIYKSNYYKNAKKQVYEMYEKFKKDNKDKIGKFYTLDYEIFKILKVKEPYFLKSPILIDEVNFKWIFDESFETEGINFDYGYVSLDELNFAVELGKKDVDKIIRKFLK